MRCHSLESRPLDEGVTFTHLEPMFRFQGVKYYIHARQWRYTSGGRACLKDEEYPVPSLNTHSTIYKLLEYLQSQSPGGFCALLFALSLFTLLRPSNIHRIVRRRHVKHSIRVPFS